MIWEHHLADALLAAGVDAGAYVPDARLRKVVSRLEDGELPLRCLTREEECIAYACGQSAAGGRPVVLMQCSGLGNALNAIGSLMIPYRIGVPLIISMRGTLGEGNPSQVPMGRATVPILEALGVQTFPVRDTTTAEAVAAGVTRLAFEAHSPAAAILEPELGSQRE